MYLSQSRITAAAGSTIAGRYDAAWRMVKNALISQYGLSAQQADYAINYAKQRKMQPDPATIARIAKQRPTTKPLTTRPMQTRPVSTVQIEDVERSLDTNTNVSKWYKGGDPVQTPATGFDIVDPTPDQSKGSIFWANNKNWLIPVGAVAAIGGLYLLTKKKK
jgi:hypothetical protein